MHCPVAYFLFVCLYLMAGMRLPKSIRGFELHRYKGMVTASLSIFLFWISVKGEPPL